MIKLLNNPGFAYFFGYFMVMVTVATITELNRRWPL